MTTSKLIAITGATGNTSTKVINSLLSSPESKNIRIRAIVRNIEKAQQKFFTGVEFAVVDDGRSFSAMVDALKGVDALYAMAPPVPEWSVTIDAVTAEAAYVAGVKHVVYLSGIGADPTSTLKILSAHGIAESMYKHYGYPLTIIRASWFMDNFLEDPNIVMDVQGQIPIPYISSTDIGKTASRILLDGPQRHACKTYNLYHPELLPPTHVAEIYKTVLGKDVPVVSITGEQVKGGLRAKGVSEFTAQAIVELMLEDFGEFYDADDKTIENITGEKPESFEEFVRDI